MGQSQDKAAATAAAAEEVISDDTLASLSFTTTPEARLPLVYSERYNISFFGLEKLHPFDAAKYEKIVGKLATPPAHTEEDSEEQQQQQPQQLHILRQDELHQPIEAPRSVLRLVHSDEYLQSLTSSARVAKILEVPPVAMLPNSVVQSRVLQPMRFATAGTILGMQLALRERPRASRQNQPSAARADADADEERKESSPSSPAAAAPSSSSSAPPPPPHAAGSAAGSDVAPGFAINLSGGYHHCSAQSGGGFCAFADITLALLVARKQFDVRRAMVVDLDAHQGNGHERDKRAGVFERAGLDVFILDMFNSGIYPHDHAAAQAIDCAVRLQSGVADEEYLALLQKHLPPSLDRHRPEFLLYNAGTDCLTGDPLGQLAISPAGILARDEFVFRSARDRGIPILMLLSGGYQKTNAQVIARSIANLREKLDLWQISAEVQRARDKWAKKQQQRSGKLKLKKEKNEEEEPRPSTAPAIKLKSEL